MDLREKLIKLRAEKGLSQQEMADRLDITRQTVSRWESGKSCPSAQQLSGICREFGIDANELLECGDNKADNHECAGRRKKGRIQIASIIILAALFAVALGGLIATIIYAVKDANFDSSATVWIVSIPSNTPMIVLSVMLGIFMLIIAALFIYILLKGKNK